MDGGLVNYLMRLGDYLAGRISLVICELPPGV
jgi:hypothetical protein